MVTVAEAGSVTYAAQMLHIVQPAVTRQIKALEDELGVVLFDRTRHGMVLTPAGDVFLTHARRALLSLERARTELTPQSGEVTGLVTLGVLESLLDVIVPPLVASVASKFPGIELRVMSGFSGYLQKWLDDGVGHCGPLQPCRYASDASQASAVRAALGCSSRRCRTKANGRCHMAPCSEWSLDFADRWARATNTHRQSTEWDSYRAKYFS